jgi:hypothetical protein
MATNMLERLLDDDVVHEQLTTAAGSVRDAVRRARKLPAQDAVQDKKVYDNVRRAAAAGSLAVRRVTGRDKPEPKHRARRFVVALAAGAVAAAVANRYTAA